MSNDLETDTITSVGKHLLLEVPNFASDYFEYEGETKTMTSFLRLGAPGQYQTQKGWDLLENFLKEAGPPGDPRLDTAKEADDTVVGNRDVVFIDDVRDRPPGDGHDMEKEARQRESNRLFSRGGWRDHSDGNRISTTYGDKVEVVRGNYKMVVMGRQDDPGSAMGWDVAGSHIQDYAPGTMPGASVYTEYIQDYEGNSSVPTGVWLLVNSTENVWEFARNAGNFREENWGDLRESYTGSENPKKISTSENDGKDGHPGDADMPFGSSEGGARPPWASTGVGLVRSNPKIIERTWAEDIDTATGSSAWRIPSINDETWAMKVNEVTDVLETVTSNTVIGGALTEATTVGGAQTSATTVGGLVLEKTTIGAAHLTFNNTAGLEFEECGASVKIGLDNALVILEEAACVFHGTIDVGLKLDITLNTGIEINLLPKLVLSLAEDYEFAIVNKTRAYLKSKKVAATFEQTALDIQLRGSTTLLLSGPITSVNAATQFAVTSANIMLG